MTPERKQELREKGKARLKALRDEIPPQTLAYIKELESKLKQQGNKGMNIFDAIEQGQKDIAGLAEQITEQQKKDREHRMKMVKLGEASFNIDLDKDLGQIALAVMLMDIDGEAELKIASGETMQLTHKDAKEVARQIFA
jgi:hypothetical protein